MPFEDYSMPEKKLKIITIAVLALILFFAAFFVYNLLFGYRYAVETNGILFVSNEKNPKDSLSEMGKKWDFFVAPQLYEVGTINAYMSNGLNLFLVVLSGNDKNAVQLLRAVNQKNELLYCTTNFGNPKTAIDLSKEECRDLLNEKDDSVKILIRFPNAGLSRSLVIVSENQIIVEPKSYDEIAAACFATVKLMYDNAEEIIEKTNLIAGAIGG